MKLGFLSGVSEAGDCMGTNLSLRNSVAKLGLTSCVLSDVLSIRVNELTGRKPLEKLCGKACSIFEYYQSTYMVDLNIAKYSS